MATLRIEIRMDGAKWPLSNAEVMRLAALLQDAQREVVAGPYVGAATMDVPIKERGEVVGYVAIDGDRCQSCLDVPGKDGLGRVCKSCNGSGVVAA